MLSLHLLQLCLVYINTLGIPPLHNRPQRVPAPHRTVRPGSINHVAFQGADLRTVGMDVDDMATAKRGVGGSVTAPSAVRKNDKRSVWKS